MCGNEKTYRLHLWTQAARLLWQYYAAIFQANAEWRPVELPFERFKPENLRKPLNPARLARIAIVAVGEEIDVDIAVSQLEFYRFDPDLRHEV